MNPYPLVTCVVLDGFGVGPETRGNAVALASTPHLDDWIVRYPVFTLGAAGELVGLPYGEVGNSEVGHSCIGSGMIPYQSLHRINQAIRDRTFSQNERLNKAFQRVIEKNSTLHLIGLLSNGGVHSLDKHLYAILEAARGAGVQNVAIHAILDGRDAPQNSAEQFVQELLGKIRELGIGQIVSLCGRYFAMDRDQRWDRTERAYRAIVDALGQQVSDPITAIEHSYEQKIFDEQFEPTVMRGYRGMQDGDAILLWNFRPDRMRQLSAALVDNGFHSFVTTPLHTSVATMTEYDSETRVSGVMFPNMSLTEPLAKILSDHNMRQMHVAETEKYAHITYFFNGGKEQPFPGEDRALIPSPHVSSYDEQPQMSASEVTTNVVEAIRSEQYAFVVANFANADMVGHTGNLEATIRAVETIDASLEPIVSETLARGGVAIITADHGNAEEMIDSHTGHINKEHSRNPVPMYVIAQSMEGHGRGLRNLSEETPVGMLADVAPTILELLGLPVASTMQGKSLLPLIFPDRS